MYKKLICLLLALCLALSLAACSGADIDEVSEDITDDVPTDAESSDAAGWTVCWYLCGSNLESEGGFATTDLLELMEAQLPEDVNVVIETGGSAVWQNDFVDASKLQRWLYNSEGLSLIDEQPSANMGDQETLREFLGFAAENFPAEKTAFIFWDHGGGSVAGAACDELYGNDALTLGEMHDAFSDVWELSGDNPPLELIGFDTCLMATVDVAYTYSDIARYLVGSEELEPGNGWLYSQWMGALADDPSMDGQALGEAICDAFYAGCEEVGTQDSITLSLTDLSKVGALVEAYDAFGAEALTIAAADPGFFSQFGRIAKNCENYGGNTREQGYTNMVDLGHLARLSSDVMTTADAVLKALDDCVLYRVNGPYRMESTGLSCYYSYNGDIEDYNGYTQVGASTAFKYFYGYELTGALDGDGMEYAESLEISELAPAAELNVSRWDGAPLDVDANGTSYLNLGPEAADILSDISIRLFYMDEENDTMMLLGSDNDITGDWDNGIFYDNFRGVWGAIDGCLVYMELNYQGDGYNLYSVPVLLNGEDYNLQTAYDFTSQEWSILGAWQGITEYGMADKELRLIEEGDEITTIWKLASVSGDDDFEDYTSDTVTVTADTAFSEAPLFDGTYRMVFEMKDATGGYACSDPVQFDCADGVITTTVFED